MDPRFSCRGLVIRWVIRDVVRTGLALPQSPALSCWRELRTPRRVVVRPSVRCSYELSAPTPDRVVSASRSSSTKRTTSTLVLSDKRSSLYEKPQPDSRTHVVEPPQRVTRARVE